MKRKTQYKNINPPRPGIAGRKKIIMEKWKKEIRKIAEKLEWTITIEEEYIYLQKYSPAGQDFNISLEAHNMEEAIAELKSIIEVIKKSINRSGKLN